MPTVKELREECKARGLSGYSTLKKADLETLLARQSLSSRASPKKPSAKSKASPKKKSSKASPKKKSSKASPKKKSSKASPKKNSKASPKKNSKASPKRLPLKPASSNEKELALLIQKHSDLYYAGHPEITDAEFDDLIDKLAVLNPKHIILNKVGKDDDGFEKVAHVIPMGSQQKARNIEELKKWLLKDYAKKIMPPHSKYIVQHKLDGMSIELQYVNGQLNKGITRGNGKIGDDISINVKKMSGAVAKLKTPFTGGVRGEIVMTRTVFEKYKKQGFRNPRNLAVGTAKQPKCDNCKDLQIIVYDVHDTTDNEAFIYEDEKVSFLSKNFPFVVATFKLSTLEEISTLYHKLEKTDREKLDIEIDGLVIKTNLVDLIDAKRVKPDKQIALKFTPIEKVTRVLDVIWSFKGSVYTPVAILEPVEVGGALVAKASLANPTILKALGLRIGSMVTITRRGDVIPKIENVVEVGKGKEVIFPRKCVQCGEELKHTDAKIYCPNRECSSKLRHQIQKWINTLNILEFGKELVEYLHEENIVDDLSDIYTLTTEQIAEFVTKGGKRIGMATAKKIIANLKAQSTITLVKFIGGLDIDMVGERIVEVLVSNGYDTIEKLRAGTIPDFEAIKGVGPARAEAIVGGLIENKETIDKLLTHISIGKATMARTAGGKLAGVSIAFTGGLETMTRKQAQERVIELGGEVRSSVGSGLTYLVSADSEMDTAKNRTARAKGVKVISEEEFIELLI